MIGPRDSVIRTLRGESVALDEWLRDNSEFIDSAWVNTRCWQDWPELWADRIYDGYYGEIGDMA